MSVPGSGLAVSSYLPGCPELREKILDGVRIGGGRRSQERNGRAAKALDKAPARFDRPQNGFLEISALPLLEPLGCARWGDSWLQPWGSGSGAGRAVRAGWAPLWLLS